MILNSHYQAVELLPFKIDTTLKTELKENFDCIYFREGKNKTNVTGNNFRRVANKLWNSRKLNTTKLIS